MREERSQKALSHLTGIELRERKKEILEVFRAQHSGTKKYCKNPFFPINEAQYNLILVVKKFVKA